MLNRLANRNVALLAKAGEELTPAFAAFLSPMAVMALALGIWAFCAQIAVTESFPIASGVLSDWRVWMLIAGGLEMAALRFRSQSTNR
ncbi:MAG: hypothetical protein JNM66_10250 [Bryobacterales bacterium]|nr:hypothetical protein [Bryobacterales bacterium]